MPTPLISVRALPKHAATSFLVNAGGILSTAIVRRAATYASLLLIARGISDSAFASYAAALAIVELGRGLLGFSADAVLIRGVAQKAIRPWLQSAVLLKSVAAVAAWLALTTTASYLQYPVSTRLMVFLSLPYLLISGWSDSTSALLQANRASTRTTPAVGLATVVYLATVLVILEAGLPPAALMLAPAVMESGVTALQVRAIGHLRSAPRLPDLSTLRAILLPSLGLGLMGFLVQAYFRFDVLLLGRLHPSDVGQYFIEFKTTEAGLLIATAVGTAALVEMASATRDQRGLQAWVSKVGTLALGTILLFQTAVCLQPRALLGALFGRSVEQADAVIPFLAAAATAMTANVVLSNLLLAVRRQVVLIPVAATNLAINVALNVMLLPRYSLVGAAWATEATEAWNLLVQIAIAWRVMGGSPFSRRLMIPLLMALAAPVFGRYAWFATLLALAVLLSTQLARLRGRGCYPKARRVLFVNASADVYGGAELCLIEMTKGLVNRGWDVQIILPRRGPLIECLRQAGGRVFLMDVGAPRSRREIRSPIVVVRAATAIVASLRLARHIRIWRPRIVHTNSSIVLAGAIAARVTRTPHVWHVREIFPKSAAPILGRLLPALSSAVVAISPSAASQLHNSRRLAQRIHMVPDGIDLSTVPKAPQGWATPRRVGMIARFNRGKGHEDFIRAAAHVSKVVDDVEFVIVGGYIAANEVAFRSSVVLVTQFGLQGRLTFCGHLSRQDALAQLATWSVLVHPARYPEGGGLVVIEAMAVGVPVVASDHGGVRDAVGGDRNAALLVPVGDSVELAGAVTSLLNDKELAAAYRRAGEALIRQEFSMGASIGALEEVYRLVAGPLMEPGDTEI